MASSKILLEMYEFNEQEVNTACLLGELTIKFIKTQLAIESMRARNLIPPATPEGYIEFVQQKAHIDGAIGAYEFLLNSHEDVVNKLSVDN